MSKKITPKEIALAVCVAGILLTWMTLRWLAPTDYTVVVSCSEPTMRFTGSIVSDGHPLVLYGTGIGTYRVRSRTIVCSFEKTQADGQISLAVSNAGQALGWSSTPARLGGVHAEIGRTFWVEHNVHNAMTVIAGSGFRCLATGCGQKWAETRELLLWS
jgi:hypothetical protein